MKDAAQMEIFTSYRLKGRSIQTDYSKRRPTELDEVNQHDRKAGGSRITKRGVRAA